MRTFLRGDPTPFKSKAELKKYISVPSFSAPKRPYAKSSYMKRPETKKHANENLHATINLVRASSTFLEEHSLEYPKNRGSEVLREVGFMDNFTKSLEIPTETDIPSKVIESIKPLGSGGKSIRGSGSRDHSVVGISDFQRTQPVHVPDEDDMLISLVEEVSRLNECLLERINENEKLKKENLNLESRFLEYKNTNKKEDMDNTISDIKGKTYTYASLESEEDQRVLEESMKKTPLGFSAKAKWKSCVKPNFNETIKCSNCVLAESLLRKHMKQDKEKLDELSLSLDNLQNNLMHKEEENYNLIKELDAVKKNHEGVSQQLTQQQQLTEKLRTELRNAHAYNQELSNKVAALRADQTETQQQAKQNTATVSFTRIESSKPNFSSHEVSEWEKKYDFARKDNERLIKIVSENQKVIQNFKNILSDIEQRHNVSYEELKRDYEEKIRGMSLSQSKNDPKFFINSNMSRDNRISFYSSMPSDALRSEMNRLNSGGNLSKQPL